MAEADSPRAGERGRTCTTCGYSLAGLAPIGVQASGAIWRCPECGTEGEMVRRGRLIVLRWPLRAMCALALGFVVFFSTFLGAVTIGQLSSQPFAEQIANSELALSKGDVFAEVDASRWTPSMSERLFADSGGWSASLLPWPAMFGLFSTALAFAVFAGLARVLYVGRLWIVLVWLAPALVLSAWGLHSVADAMSDSPVTSFHPRTLAFSRAGVDVGYGVIAAVAVAAICGARAGWHRPVRRASRHRGAPAGRGRPARAGE